MKNYALQLFQTQNLAQKLERVTSEMDRVDAWGYEGKIKGILNALAITRLDQKMGKPLWRYGEKNCISSRCDYRPRIVNLG